MSFVAPLVMPILPELVLGIGAMALLMLGAFRGDGAYNTCIGVAIALLLGAAFLVFFIPDGRITTFGDDQAIGLEGSFILDDFARFMKVLILFGSATAIVMSVDWMRIERLQRFEYPVLILLSAAGMLVMVSANDLIALYMGIELQALAAYVIATINRDNLRSTEAGLKYFVLGALSSGMLLYGMSLVYGFTGTVSLPGIALILATADVNIGLIFGIVFLLAGLAFKISAVPFHMWTPDVYEGAPTPITAFFAAAPKVAGMAIILRVLADGLLPVVDVWQQIIAFIAVASMILGAFAAIGQTNIKRLMAYSSIGHMGYALVGLAAGSAAGFNGVVIYMTIYMVTTLGVFGCILGMRRSDGYVEDMNQLAGLWRTQPGTAIALALMMFSLIGVPPLAGFFAKWYVFVAAIEVGLYPLAVIGVLTSAVGAFYYLRIVKLMFFDEPAPEFVAMPFELSAVVAISSGFVVLLAVFIGGLALRAQTVSASLFF